MLISDACLRWKEQDEESCNENMGEQKSFSEKVDVKMERETAIE